MSNIKPPDIWPQIYVISRQGKVENKLASKLSLETVRVGFPNFPINWCMLGKYEQDEELEAECLSKDCKMEFYPRRNFNHEFIELILAKACGPVIFLDSDMIFWKNCEHFEVPKDCDFRGRLIPTHYDAFTNSITISRLHSSFLWIISCQELRRNIELAYKDSCRFTPYNVVAPFYFKHRGQNVFYDTCAGLFHSVNSKSFSEQELDCFDHMMAGSFVDEIAAKCLFPIYQNMLKYHREIEQDRSKLKGIWRKQEEYFKLCAGGIKNELAF